MNLANFNVEDWMAGELAAFDAWGDALDARQKVRDAKRAARYPSGSWDWPCGRAARGGEAREMFQRWQQNPREWVACGRMGGRKNFGPVRALRCWSRMVSVHPESFGWLATFEALVEAIHNDMFADLGNDNAYVTIVPRVFVEWARKHSQEQLRWQVAFTAAMWAISHPEYVHSLKDMAPPLHAMFYEELERARAWMAERCVVLSDRLESDRIVGNGSMMSDRSLAVSRIMAKHVRAGRLPPWFYACDDLGFRPTIPPDGIMPVVQFGLHDHDEQRLNGVTLDRYVGDVPKFRPLTPQERERMAGDDLSSRLEASTIAFDFLMYVRSRKQAWPAVSMSAPKFAAVNEPAGEPVAGPTVYFVTDGEYVKIGYTAGDVKTRIASLQTGNPRSIRLLAVASGPKSLERELHEAFADRRVVGEWFRLSLDDIRALCPAAVALSPAEGKL